MIVVLQTMFVTIVTSVIIIIIVNNIVNGNDKQ